MPNHYPHIDEMLAGAPFDLLVNLTDMQEHERLNGQAIEAGKHVWSEKPMANSYRKVATCSTWRRPASFDSGGRPPWSTARNSRSCPR